MKMILSRYIAWLLSPASSSGDSNELPNRSKLLPTLLDLQRRAAAAALWAPPPAPPCWALQLLSKGEPCALQSAR